MGYFREEVDKLEAYVPGEQPKEPGYLKLNTNENPFSPSPRVKQAIEELVGDGALRLYPDPLAAKLKSAIKKLTGQPLDGIICGNGSDDILAMLVRACGQPGQRVILTYPSYTLYRVL